jgi:hypothetical protein
MDNAKRLSLVAIMQQDAFRRGSKYRIRTYRRIITSGTDQESASSVVDDEASRMLALLSMEEIRERRDGASYRNDGASR